MQNNYFETLKADPRHDFLTASPTKAGAIQNAARAGVVRILGGSYNRAITIETESEIFLQSYDTLILVKDKATGEVKKLWDGYSKTTLKHVNDFLGTAYSKKEWENL